MNYPQKRGHSEPGAAATTSDWGPKKIAFFPSSSINKHLFRACYLFSFMFQSWASLSRPLLNPRIGPEEAALGCQLGELQEVSSVWRTQCLEGLALMCSLGSNLSSAT